MQLNIIVKYKMFDNLEEEKKRMVLVYVLDEMKCYNVENI